MEREILPKIPSRIEHEILTKNRRGRGKGQSKGQNRDWTPKDYSQKNGEPGGSRESGAGGKSGEKSGEKSAKGQGKSGNQEDSKVNGNPLYTEMPANKTFGSNKDTGG